MRKIPSSLCVEVTLACFPHFNQRRRRIWPNEVRKWGTDITMGSTGNVCTTGNMWALLMCPMTENKKTENPLDWSLSWWLEFCTHHLQEPHSQGGSQQRTPPDPVWLGCAGSQRGPILPPVESCGVATSWGEESYWHLVGRGQDCCPTPSYKTAPTQRIICSQNINGATAEAPCSKTLVKHWGTWGCGRLSRDSRFPRRSWSWSGLWDRASCWAWVQWGSLLEAFSPSSSPPT